MTDPMPDSAERADALTEHDELGHLAEDAALTEEEVAAATHLGSDADQAAGSTAPSFPPD